MDFAHAGWRHAALALIQINLASADGSSASPAD